MQPEVTDEIISIFALTVRSSSKLFGKVILFLANLPAIAMFFSQISKGLGKTKLKGTMS